MRPAERTGAEVDRLLGLDPDVPGLALLLDDDALDGWLAGRLGAAGRTPRARRTYLRWKPGAGGVARVRLDAPHGRGGPDLFLAVWHRDSAAKLDKTVLRGGRAVVAVDRAALAVLARPAADRDLPGLGRLHAAGPGSTLRRLAPVDDRAHRMLRRAARADGAVRTLAWKPRRRWVGLVSEPDDAMVDVRSVGTEPGTRSRAVVLRAYRPSETDGVERGHRAAEAALGRSAARLMATDARRGLLAVRHVPGRTLDLLGPEATLAGAGPAGDLLARLHRHDAGAGTAGAPLPVRTRASEVDEVRAAAAMLELLVPDAGTAELAERVRAELERLPAVPDVLLHGDLSADQVVVGPDGSTTLIDLDEVSLGPSSVDLAGAAASWALADPCSADERSAALLEGYGRRATVPSSRELRTRTAAHLFRRAPEPFRAGSPTWPTQVRDAVVSARAALDGTSVLP